MPEMPLFTAENAAEMAKRSWAPTSARHAADNPPDNNAGQDGALFTQAAGQYAGERLMRVRRQLASLDKKIGELILEASEENAGAIDRLCAAQAKLAEQERILAGRPLPGSHRPRQSAGPRRPSAADPLAE